MPWTIYHGGAGPGGSGIDLQGLGQLAYAKRQAAAQPNSALAAFGQGAGEGIAKGSENVWKFALQNFFDSKGDERKADLWGKREDALLNRQVEINAQKAMQHVGEEEYARVNSEYHSLYQSGQVPSIVAKRWDELSSDESGLTTDSAARLTHEKRYAAFQAIQREKSKLLQSIPRPTESQKAASKMYSFAEIAPELQKRGFDPQSLSPAAQKALAGSIWTANRNGVPEMAFNPTEFEEKIAKIEAERASSGGGGPMALTLGDWSQQTADPMAQRNAMLMLSTGQYNPGTIASVNPKTSMFDIQEGTRLPSMVDEQREAQEKSEKLATARAAEADRLASDKASRVMGYLDTWRKERGTDAVAQRQWESVNGPSDPESLRAKAIARVEEEDRWREQFKQQAVQKQQIDDALNTATEADMAEYRAIYQAMKAGGVQPGDEALFESLKARFGG